MKKMLLGIIEIKITILPVAQQKHTNRKIIHLSTEMEVTSKLIKCHVITMNDEVEREMKNWNCPVNDNQLMTNTHF
mgnify:CR=1 FL=1